MYAEHGDSGSPVFRDNPNLNVPVVGLLFAGLNGSAFNGIARVQAVTGPSRADTVTGRCMRHAARAKSRMNRLAKLLAIATALSCGQREEPSAVADPKLAAATAVVGTVQMRLEVPAASRLATDVPITLTITNGGTEPVELQVSDRLEFDVVVRGADQSVVWQRSGGGPTVGAGVVSDPLAPGASRRFETSWTQRDGNGRMVTPARYAIEGIVFAGPPLSGVHVGPLHLAIAR